jgi:hypothetical protein
MIPLPQTEFQTDLKKSNRSPIEMWLEHFTASNSSKIVVSLTNKHIFGLFSDWIEENKIKYEVNGVKFFVRLKNLNIGGVETTRAKAGNMKAFDIVKLEQHFGLTSPIVSSTPTVAETDSTDHDDDTEEEFDESFD